MQGKTATQALRSTYRNREVQHGYQDNNEECQENATAKNDEVDRSVPAMKIVTRVNFKDTPRPGR